jgi:pre-mRNA-splicing factor ATP-dependent RNA helicase DHX38/PRP16
MGFSVLGGRVEKSRVDVDELDLEEERVLLIVHDTKPPFLDGKTVFTKQTQAVAIVRDPNSDFV